MRRPRWLGGSALPQNVETVHLMRLEVWGRDKLLHTEAVACLVGTQFAYTDSLEQITVTLRPAQLGSTLIVAERSPKLHAEAAMTKGTDHHGREIPKAHRDP